MGPSGRRIPRLSYNRRAARLGRAFSSKHFLMPIITLPDGSERSYPTPVDGGAVARSIGPRLERDAVAVRIDGKLSDLTLPIDRDARVEIVTRASEDGLELLRHDAAQDRKSTRLNSSHSQISYAVFCLKKKKQCAILHGL